MRWNDKTEKGEDGDDGGVDWSIKSTAVIDEIPRLLSIPSVLLAAKDWALVPGPLVPSTPRPLFDSA